jgi:hypothetical protein
MSKPIAFKIPDEMELTYKFFGVNFHFVVERKEIKEFQFSATNRDEILNKIKAEGIDVEKIVID